MPMTGETDRPLATNLAFAPEARMPTESGNPEVSWLYCAAMAKYLVRIDNQSLTAWDGSHLSLGNEGPMLFPKRTQAIRVSQEIRPLLPGHHIRASKAKMAETTTKTDDWWQGL